MGESFLSIFTGSSQSRYAGLAIFFAVIVVSLVILFGKDSIPFSQKLSFVLLIFLISLPAILMTLFQLTCLVRGAGENNERWWCGVYAWIISIILVLYCILLVFVAITALITGEKVLQDIHDDDKQEFQRNTDTATMIVQEYFATNKHPNHPKEAQAEANDYSKGMNMNPNNETPEWIKNEQGPSQGNIQLVDTPVQKQMYDQLFMQEMNLTGAPHGPGVEQFQQRAHGPFGGQDLQAPAAQDPNSFNALTNLAAYPQETVNEHFFNKNMKSRR